ncbi:hypothetical protein [Leptospira noguchii]|uniref:Uncharacterized protein n=1 Tax=Leptospira noguchii TaxID=28182 RepID=M6W1J6_9LEPT|nr:hypothetical protein [Leptospira noguchii]EMO55678.1 hypothetical protein LEP1GSC172_0589 [Leptospira noguchii]
MSLNLEGIRTFVAIHKSVLLNSTRLQDQYAEFYRNVGTLTEIITTKES